MDSLPGGAARRERLAERVQLVYFPGCPHVAAAREAIRSALRAEGLALAWKEWNRDDASTPPHLRSFGSPTVLVDGRDVSPAPTQGACCRLYTTERGTQGVPPVELLRTALRAAPLSQGSSQDHRA